MKTIRLTLDNPIVVENSKYTHVSTSYRVSRIPNFDDPGMIIHEALESTDLITHEFEFDIESDRTLYAIVKFHFLNTDTNTPAESDWSKAIPINGNQTGIKRYGTVVATPVVKTKITTVNNDSFTIDIDSSAFKLYAGSGNHSSTDYVITDTYNNIIWEQTNDTVNLTSLTISPDVIKLGKIYLVKVRYTTEEGISSNYGTAIFSTRSLTSKIFDLVMPYSLAINRYNYFKLYLNVPNFQSVDIIVKNKYGQIVAEEYNQATRTPHVYTLGLELGSEYTVSARVKFQDNTYTEYIDFYTVNTTNNDITIADNTITYLNDYDYTQELLLNGPIAAMSKEIYTGTILLPKNNDNKLYRYELRNKVLIEDKALITLDGLNELVDLPSLNITPLRNGRFLLDYDAVRAVNINSSLVSQETRDYMITNNLETYDDNGLWVINRDNFDQEYVTRPKFAIYEYNSVTHECTLVDSIFRDDEMKSTATTNALVVNSDNQYIYYIPTHATDSIENNDSYLDLTLKRLDVDTLDIVVVDPLPVSILANPVLIGKDSNTLIFMNGSDTITDMVNNEYIWLRTNDDIYEYNIGTDTWTNTGTMDIGIDPEKYLLQSIKRRDGKIALFNNSRLGTSVGDQDSIVFDPVTYDFTIDSNDMIDDMIYQTSIDLLNGDILRLTSRVQDPQVVYTYVSNTRTMEELLGDSLINIITDLVVPQNEVITVNDIYRYETIVIEGTDDTNTGKLVWIHDDELIEFKWNDLIVTRDMDLPRNIYDGPTEYKTVTILEGALLDMYNVIIIPSNTNASIQLPVTFRTLSVPDTSTLTFTDPA